MNRQSTALLDHDDVEETSGESYRSSRLGDRLSDRQTPVPKRVLRRVADDDYDDDRGEGSFLRSQTRIRVRRGLIPESVWGRIFAGVVLFVSICAVVAGMLVVRNFFLHDPRFLIEDSSAIQIDGNSHVSRPQMLSIFGEDIGRNLFYVSLAERRKELETLPWVEHATVMRLLPNRLRVSVVERTPVAFVRQAGQIGLVDAYGMLLDLPADDSASAKYSFPVLTGITAADPLSTRAARMKIYQQFIRELDSSGPKLSETLSEVDVSNPEDVKALIPDHTSEILVHFGDENFLDRYQRYQQQLPTWRSQYPNLASVDTRYPNQFVLDMAPGTDASATVPDANAAPAPSKPAASVSVPAVSVPPPPPSNPQSGKKSAATPMMAAPVAAPPVAKSLSVKTSAPVAVKAPVTHPDVAKTSAAKATVAKTSAAKPPIAKTAASTLPAPKRLSLPPTSTARTTLPPANVLPAGLQANAKPGAKPATQSGTPVSQLNTQHPLTQSFDVPAKKKTAAKAKAKTAKAKSSTKKKPAVVKSIHKAAKPSAQVKATPITSE